MRHIQRNDISSPERGEEHTSRKREEREEVLGSYRDGIATNLGGEPLIKIFRSEGTNLASLKWGETAVEVRASNVSLGTDWPNYERKRLAHSSSRISRLQLVRCLPFCVKLEIVLYL